MYFVLNIYALSTKVHLYQISLTDQLDKPGPYIWDFGLFAYSKDWPNGQYIVAASESNGRHVFFERG